MRCATIPTTPTGPTESTASSPARSRCAPSCCGGGAAASDPGLRRALLEVYTRRFYRIRELRDLAVGEHDGRLLGTADYDYEGQPIHLVTAYAPLTELPELSRAIAGHLATVDIGRQVVVDLALWRHGEDVRCRRRHRRGRQTPVRLRLRPPAAPAGPDRDDRRRGGTGALPHPSRDLPPAGWPIRRGSRSTAICTRCSPSGWTCGGWRTSSCTGCARPRTCTCSTAWPTTTPPITGCSRSPKCAT